MTYLVSISLFLIKVLILGIHLLFLATIMYFRGMVLNWGASAPQETLGNVWTHFWLSQFGGMLLALRVQARMRRLAPGPNPTWGLSGLSRGNYEGFAQQASWGKAALPSHTVSQGSRRGNAVPSGPPCSCAHLHSYPRHHQGPPSQGTLAEPLFSCLHWDLLKRAGRGSGRFCFSAPSLSCLPYPGSPGFIKPQELLVQCSSEVRHFSSTCTACHLIDPCPLPSHRGQWQSGSPALLFFLASCLYYHSKRIKTFIFIMADSFDQLTPCSLE